LRDPLYYRFAGRSTQAVVVISTDVRLDVREMLAASLRLSAAGSIATALIKYEHRDMIVAH
jgi:hypothetical protein